MFMKNMKINYQVDYVVYNSKLLVLLGNINCDWDVSI